MRTRHDSTHIDKGPSLAKGPAWIVGSVLAIFGLILFFEAPGTPLGTDRLPDGQVAGASFLGFEINAWTAWITTTAGVMVLIGVIQHVIAKTMSLLVGLALGAAAVIALVDGSDVLGLAAANGLTALGWGVAAAILIVTALLPRRMHEARDAHTTQTTRSRDGDGMRDRDEVRTTRDGSLDAMRDRDEVRSGDFRGSGDQSRDMPNRVEPVPTADARPMGSGSPETKRTGRFSRSHQDGSADETQQGEPVSSGRSVQIPPRRDR